MDNIVSWRQGKTLYTGKTFIVTKDTLAEGIDFLRSSLAELKVPMQSAIKCVLSAEEIIVLMLNSGVSSGPVTEGQNSTPQNTEVRITVNKFLGKSSVKLVSAGEKISLDNISQDYSGENDDEYNEAIQKLFDKVLGSDVHLTYKNYRNICSISVAESRYQSLINITVALILGIIFGLFLKFCCSEEVARFISQKFLTSISTMFMNALKMIVGPLVFFSMANSIADFTDLNSLGRTALKTLFGFFATSLLAIGVGYFVYQLFPVGDPSLLNAVTDGASAAIANGSGASFSIADTIVNIVPSSFAGPFTNNDMLQILFIGVLLGIGVSALSAKYPGGKKAVNYANDLFAKITAIIVGFMPLAVFCDMSKMIAGTDISTFLHVFKWIPVCYVGFAVMIVIYFIIIFVFARINPFNFFRHFYPVMLTAFSLGSSTAVVPAALDCCEEKLGVAKRISSFAIPLGSTINKDGVCTTLMITALMMASVFGITITSSMYLTLVIAIMSLSFGSPGVPGGALVCCAILLPMIGIPAEAISIIMGIYSLVGMGMACVNVTGDAVISVVVAKSENLLDMTKYNGK